MTDCIEFELGNIVSCTKLTMRLCKYESRVFDTGVMLTVNACGS
jgi:hypothetical protein